MQTKKEFDVYANLPSPLLTIYINSVGENRARHPQQRSDLAWLQKAAAEMIRNLPYRDAKRFHRQVERVVQFLQNRRPAEKALVLFAGPRTWKSVSLQSAVKQELTWGAPRVEQLLPLLEGHRRYGVVVMDHAGARYFSYSQSGLQLLSKQVFEVDITQWKRKDSSRIGSEGVQKSRGPQQDLHAQRLAAQYEQICRRVAREIDGVTQFHKFSATFLVGPDRLIDIVQSQLPSQIARTAVLVRENLAGSSAKALTVRLRPIIENYDAELQLSSVNSLLNADRGALTNPEEIISELQNGRLHTLIVAEGERLALKKCPSCGIASTSADRVCSECGSPRQQTALPELLPELLSAKHTKVEFVSGMAAALLQKTGGLGGWLRPAQRATAK